MEWKLEITSLRADVSYFLCFMRKSVPFPREVKEIGDICTQARNYHLNVHVLNQENAQLLQNYQPLKCALFAA